MGNHSKCLNCGELDEFCVCKAQPSAPTSGNPAASSLAAPPVDLSAHGLIQMWRQAEETATATMPAPFQFAKILLSKPGIFEEKRNALLEEVAQWLDTYDGKDMRRAEYVRSLKTFSGRPMDAASATSAGAENIDKRVVSEARRTRIVALQRELLALLGEEAEEAGLDHAALVEECRKLKQSGKVMEAAKLYRAKTGFSLREAHDAVQAMN